MTSLDQLKARRRPHTKSRLGCQECKRRKIKCSEDHPTCLNCTQRDVACNYTAGSDRPAELEPTECSCRSPNCSKHEDSGDLREIITSQGDKLDIMSQQLSSLQAEVERLKSVQRPCNLDHTEMELLYHYFLITTHNHPKEDIGHNFWCVRLLEMGFKHPHVLHLILGFAGIDKARCTPDQQADLLAKAEHYHTLGLQDATLLLGAINDENYEVVYASALLISLHNVALGPQPGEYLGFSNSGRSRFMVFLRGLKSIREYKRQPEKDTRLNFPELPARSCAVAESPKPVNVVDYLTHIEDLRRLVEEFLTSSDWESKTPYLEAISQLEPFFSAAYQTTQHVYTSDTYVQVPLGWLCRVPDAFLSCLESKDPLALVIFSYFTVILKQLQSGWPVHGWPEHIMSGIRDFLPVEHRSLLKWPMEQIAFA